MALQYDTFVASNNEQWRAFDKHLTALRHSNKLTPATSFEELQSQLSPGEQSLMQALLDINLPDYSITTPSLGIEAVPENLIILEEGHAKSTSADYDTKRQYLPAPAAKAFQTMRRAFAGEQPGRQLIVVSGYRSPAFQISTLTSYYVHFHNFDIGSTLKQVALPSCSQHCSASNPALDLGNLDGQPSDEDPQAFAKSPEYAWLKVNAGKYDFRESYPPGNNQGIMWEPWHWQYLPATSQTTVQ